MKFETFTTVLGTLLIIIWAIALFGWWSSNNALTEAINAQQRAQGCWYLPEGEKVTVPSGSIISDINFTNDPTDKKCGKDALVPYKVKE